VKEKLGLAVRYTFVFVTPSIRSPA